MPSVQYLGFMQPWRFTAQANLVTWMGIPMLGSVVGGDDGQLNVSSPFSWKLSNPHFLTAMLMMTLEWTRIPNWSWNHWLATCGGCEILEETAQWHSPGRSWASSPGEMPFKHHCKGVVWCWYLQDESEDNIMNEHTDQGVITTCHTTVRCDGVPQPSDTLILTFNKPRVKEYIMAGYLWLPGWLFVPSPLRCFKCQCYSHGQTSCTGKAVCCSCGRADHSPDPCQSGPSCINCKGAHLASSRDCLTWQQEHRI